MVKRDVSGVIRSVVPVGLIALVVVAAAMYSSQRGFFSGDDSARTAGVDPEVETESIRAYSEPIRTVALYFSDAKAERLVAETREVAGVHEPVELVKLLVQELEAGPMGELAPTVPPGTSLRHVFRDGDGTLFLDFAPEFLAGHPGGTRAELMTLRSIAETIVVNVPGAAELRFLVDGEEMSSIAGHLDVRVESLVAGRR